MIADKSKFICAAAVVPVELVESQAKEQFTRVSYAGAKHVLWIPFGMVTGLFFVYLSFGSHKFGNPLIAHSYHAWDCMFMCSTLWVLFLCWVYYSHINDLFIKRRLIEVMGLPPIHDLPMRLTIGSGVGLLAMSGTWLSLVSMVTATLFGLKR